MKKLKFLLLPLFVLGSFVLGYNQTLDQRIKNIYKPLDKTQVKSGLLIHQTPIFIWPGKYDGKNTEPEQRLSLDQFGVLYGQFRGAATRRQLLPDPQIYLSKVLPGKNQSRDVVELMFMMRTFDYIKASAQDRSLVQWSDGQLHEVGGRSESPFLQDTSYAYTLLQDEFKGLSVPFKLSSELLFNNLGWEIEEVMIDFDDGRGFRVVPLDQVMAIEYPLAGLKELHLRYLKDGQAFDMVSAITISAPRERITTGRNNIPYDEANPETVSLSGMDLKIFSACDDGTLRNPLIVEEGFGGNSTPEDLFERLNQQTSEGESLNNYLNTNEYDLVWVDYVDAFAAIEENADNLIEVIDWVNSRKYADGSNEPNNIIAFSMGGLVAKLALLKMYNVQNRDPEVERFFSWDSPLQGANYPLGIQAFLRDVIYNAANFGASTASLQEAIFLLDSGAAVDLLKARVEIDCTTNST